MSLQMSMFQTDICCAYPIATLDSEAPTALFEDGTDFAARTAPWRIWPVDCKEGSPMVASMRQPTFHLSRPSRAFAIVVISTQEGT
jgi:hypothetical protein